MGGKVSLEEAFHSEADPGIPVVFVFLQDRVNGVPADLHQGRQGRLAQTSVHTLLLPGESSVRGQEQAELLDHLWVIEMAQGAVSGG